MVPLSAAEKLDENRALYVQIADAIIDYIRDNGLTSGDKLPSQNVLMRQFGVSQATVRHALLNLSNQGLVIAHQGKGVFVSKPRMQADLSRPLISTKNGSGQPGFEIEFIGAELVFAPERVAELLDVRVGAQITRYRRKVFAGQELVGMETVNVSLPVAQAFSEADMRNSDLLAVLGRSADTAVANIDLTISAGFITDFDAEILGVASDETVMQRIEISRNQEGQPVMMTRTVLLADRIDFTSQVTLTEGSLLR